MWSYVFISAGVAVTTAVLMYLDSRLTDRPKQKMTYIKVIVMNIIIVLAAIMLLTRLSPTENIKDVMQVKTPITKITGGGMSMVKVPGVGEEMFSGPPTF